MRLVRSTYRCNTCHRPDVETHWESGKVQAQDPRLATSRECPDCGHELQYLCDVCGDPLVRELVEDITWLGIGGIGVRLILFIGGLMLGGWRGATLVLVGLGLFGCVSIWLRSIRPGHLKIERNQHVDPAPLKVLLGRALEHEKTRRSLFSLSLTLVVLIGVGIFLLQVRVFGFLPGGYIAIAAFGALLAGKHWETLQRQSLMALDARPLITMCSQDPTARDRLRRTLKVVATKILLRKPDAWEIRRLETLLDAAIEHREFVACSDKDIDLALIRPILLHAVQEGASPSTSEPDKDHLATQ